MYTRSFKRNIAIGMADDSNIIACLNLELQTAHEDTDLAPVRLNCSNIMILVGLLEQTIAKFYEGELLTDDDSIDEDDEEDED
jgi:hypothetical protein